MFTLTVIEHVQQLDVFCHSRRSHTHLSSCRYESENTCWADIFVKKLNAT